MNDILFCILLTSCILYVPQVILVNAILIITDDIKDKLTYFLWLIPWFIAAPFLVLIKFFLLPNK